MHGLLWKFENCSSLLHQQRCWNLWRSTATPFMDLVCGTWVERRPSRCSLPGTTRWSWSGGAQPGQGHISSRIFLAVASHQPRLVSSAGLSSSSIASGRVQAMRFRSCPGILPGMFSLQLAEIWDLSKILPILIHGPPAPPSSGGPWSAQTRLRCPWWTGGGCPTWSHFCLKEEKPADKLWKKKKPDWKN